MLTPRRLKTGIVRASAALLAIMLMFAGFAQGQVTHGAEPVPWAYDPGPDPTTAMGRELIDLVATQPNMPKISTELTGHQKFRPAFGPTLWRMLLVPDSIQALYLGQDGTHIAEAAGRTATAGFGGRAQDLATYLGIRTSAGFINTFAYTIKGQYGSFESPMVMVDTNGNKLSNDALNPDLHEVPVLVNEQGKKSVQFTAMVDNGLWLMSQDPSSPMVKWRNSLIDWIIRNNRNSLKLVVLFGGSARDSIGSFVESRGGKVGTRYSAEQLAGMKLPQTKLMPAGGNNEFPALVDKDGRDVYSQLLGREIDYTNVKNVEAAKAALQSKIESVYDRLSISNGGVGGSGVLHPAQVGGYNLEKMEIAGQISRSLKGLVLSDGSAIGHDIVVINSPHPTALSMMEPADASKAIARALEPLKPFVAKGWAIQAEPGMINHFAAGEPYKYGRSEIPRAYYDFGTPNNRMVPRSDASRLKPDVIVVGTRDRVNFDQAEIDRIRNSISTAPQMTDGLADQWTARPRGANRYVFDRGPGLDIAKIFYETIDMNVIGQPKPGMTYEKNGIDAFNIKSHPTSVGAFAPTRGQFQNPRVIVLADPSGFDDVLTSEALTGTRGQFLHGLLAGLGIADKYAVLKTVPFAMDGATDAEWKVVLEQTRAYREQILKLMLSRSTPEVIIADGANAAAEIKRILGPNSKIAVVNIERNGIENAEGLREAARELAKLAPFHQFRDQAYEPAMRAIPRSHLPFLARSWLGTSGCCVVNSSDANSKGLGLAIVAPTFAVKQDLPFTAEEQSFIDQARARLDKLGLPRPNETQKAFEARRQGLEEDAGSAGVSCGRVFPREGRSSAPRVSGF